MIHQPMTYNYDNDDINLTLMTIKKLKHVHQSKLHASFIYINKASCI